VVERPFSQEGSPIIVAHRGASAERPENTMTAFERAVEVGADAVEFDVRITADGVAVILHDADVARTTDGVGLVRDLTLTEVKGLRISSGASAEEVPTLEEALRYLSGRCAVDVEIKNIPGEPDFEPDAERAVDAVFRTLEEVGFAGPVLISSFNPASIDYARAHRPDLPTGLLTPPVMSGPDSLAAAAAAGHPWVLPYIGAVRAAGAARFASNVHAAGLRLGTWLTDDPIEAVGLLRAGLDAVATNDPAAVAGAR
jgi:glycerophosphoryl diester phosphodiesterase